jgi:hypothetical protein
VPPLLDELLELLDELELDELELELLLEELELLDELDELLVGGTYVTMALPLRIWPPVLVTITL